MGPTSLRVALTAALLAGCAGPSTGTASHDAAALDTPSPTDSGTPGWDVELPDTRPDVSSTWYSPDATLDDAPRAAVCPATPPTPGTPCTPYDVWESYCSYGTEALSDCRTIFRCRVGSPTWVEIPGCKMVTDCPAAPAAGKACGVTLGRCVYLDGEHCVCHGWDPPTYHCKRPDAGCPSVAPNAGTVCDTLGQLCEYRVQGPCCDSPSIGYLASCKGGVWFWTFDHGGP